MNRRIKKKKLKQARSGYTTKSERMKNKALCKRYPFLIPRNVWTGKISWHNKPYDHTLARWFPEGWWKAFGLQLCEEIREDCLKHDYLHRLRIEDIKEKYAGLRIYTGPVPRESEIDNIISDYSALSESICMHCGKPDVYMLNWCGWLTTICEDCFYRINKRNLRKGWIAELPNYADFIGEGDTGRMPDQRSYTRYSQGQSEKHVVDLREKAEKIRARWRATHHDGYVPQMPMLWP